MTSLQVALVVGCLLAGGLLVVPQTTTAYGALLAIAVLLSVVIGPLLEPGT